MLLPLAPKGIKSQAVTNRLEVNVVECEPTDNKVVFYDMMHNIPVQKETVSE